VVSSKDFPQWIVSWDARLGMTRCFAWGVVTGVAADGNCLAGVAGFGRLAGKNFVGVRAADLKIGHYKGLWPI
jgi:hypothetical protein